MLIISTKTIVDAWIASSLHSGAYCWRAAHTPMSIRLWIYGFGGALRI